MSNKVRVTGDESGSVIIISDNPIFGYVRLEQEKINISNDGWLEESNLSALLRGPVSILKKKQYTINQELPGKIRIIEQTHPFNHKNPEKDLKKAGETDIICRIDGQPIYRNSFYTEDLSLTDELVKHDNGEEIKSKIAFMKAEQDKKANL
jgi:hypothetical protein